MFLITKLFMQFNLVLSPSLVLSMEGSLLNLFLIFISLLDVSDRNADLVSWLQNGKHMLGNQSSL